jgi:hypothetical protein
VSRSVSSQLPTATGRAQLTREALGVLRSAQADTGAALGDELGQNQART